MKINMMSSQYGLASACRNTVLSRGGSEAILTVGVSARVRQEQSAQSRIGRPAAVAAFAATGAPFVPAPEAGYAPTKHALDGGLRGPYPWRKPPVIT